VATPSRDPIRVLIVVADAEVGRSIVATLDRAPYEARLERNAIEAVRTMRVWRPSLLLMDVDAGTARLIAELSEASAFGSLPVIGLIRKHELATELAALDAGVDDIVAAPFVPDEIRAHIRALMRRTYGPYRPVLALRVGKLEINLVERCVRAGDRRIHLTSLELALLYLLAAEPGDVISRDTILDALWGVDFAPDNNVLERHVSRLRTKLLEELQGAYRIETVRGHGYRLVPPGP
jgi:two-component system, OmpR family, response regulator MtrA